MQYDTKHTDWSHTYTNIFSRRDSFARVQRTDCVILSLLKTPTASEIENKNECELSGNHFVVTQNEAIFVYQNSLKHTLRPYRESSDSLCLYDFGWAQRANSGCSVLSIDAIMLAENHYRFGFVCACKRDCTPKYEEKKKSHIIEWWRERERGERLKSLESAIVQ